MSLIGAKRAQQGVFEALASQNRVAGSGGGSGLKLQTLGTVSFNVVGPITATGTPTVVTGSSLTIQVPPSLTSLLVIGTVNAGSNCAAGLFNDLALNGSAGLTPQAGVWPFALLLGIGAGTINYLPVTLLTLCQCAPGQQSVNWQVNPNTNGSVTVNNGKIDVFALG